MDGSNRRGAEDDRDESAAATSWTNDTAQPSAQTFKNPGDPGLSERSRRADDGAAEPAQATLPSVGFRCSIASGVTTRPRGVRCRNPIFRR